MVLTMAAVADHKGIQVSGLEVQVLLRDPGEGSESGPCFESTVRLGPGLSPREQRLLFNAARTCEIHKLLRQPVRFQETLEVE